MSALRSRLAEFSGGLGDAGLLIPLTVAMITLNGLNATAAFVVTGLVYAGTALYFRVPVPVQPLKAFAAAAIALGLSAETIAAGALLMSVAMFALASFGLADRIATRFPIVLVRGIQASVALLLAKAAVNLAMQGNWPGLPPISAEVGLAMAAAACLLLFVFSRASLPGSLIILAAGAVVGLAVGGFPQLELGPQPVTPALPSPAAFPVALTSLVLAQLPLTFGNSIVATADAERTYFGERAARVTPGRLALSIGLANGAAGLTGALPVCHGAGGVTAHYKLGARTAISTGSVGVLLIVLGLAFGASLPALVQVLAPGALAGMLAFVAVQHSLLAGSLARLDDRLIAASVGGATLLAGNLAIGFGLGVALLGTRAAWRRGGAAARRLVRARAA